MADITMCTNEHCGMRGTCYRYQAVPNAKNQSYAVFQPDRGGCSEFLPLLDKEGKEVV